MVYKTTEYQERKRIHEVEIYPNNLKCNLPVGLFLASSENQRQVQGSLFFPHFLQVRLLSPTTENQTPFILDRMFTFTSHVKEMISQHQLFHSNIFLNFWLFFGISFKLQLLKAME